MRALCCFCLALLAHPPFIPFFLPSLGADTSQAPLITRAMLRRRTSSPPIVARTRGCRPQPTQSFLIRPHPAPARHVRTSNMLRVFSNSRARAPIQSMCQLNQNSTQFISFQNIETDFSPVEVSWFFVCFELLKSLKREELKVNNWNCYFLWDEFLICVNFETSLSFVQI